MVRSHGNEKIESGMERKEEERDGEREEMSAGRKAGESEQKQNKTK